MAKTSKAPRADDKPEKSKAEKAKAAKMPKPKAVKAKATKPKLTKPKLAKPKLAKPKLAKPKLAKPKAGKSKTARAAQPAAQEAMAPHAPALRVMPPLAIGATAAVLDRLWGVVMARRDADPAISHSARLLARGNAKVAQKFGEEAVECLIEAVTGNRDALVAESADVLYHLLVLWVASGVRPDEVWSELHRREGVSGIAEKASRAVSLPVAAGLRTTKIP